MFEFAKWMWGFWYLRGVSVAFLLIVLAQGIWQFEWFEALSFVRALVFVWEDFGAFAGELIGKLPFVPVLSSGVVGVVALALTVSSASMFRQSVSRDEAVETVGSTVLHFAFLAPMLLVLYHNLTFFADGHIQVVSYLDLMILTLLLFLLVMVLAFGHEAIMNRGFRMGVLTFVATIVTIEILYQLNTPLVRGAIQSFVDAQIGPEVGAP